VVVITTALAALVLGVAISITLTNRLLAPLGVLTQAVNRLGQGDFLTRAVVSTQDEIGKLANQFNTMAKHLGDYRNSSLGELLLAQQASQAAIDSIPDPVIVFTADGGILSMNSAAQSLMDGASPGGSETPWPACLPRCASRWKRRGCSCCKATAPSCRRASTTRCSSSRTIRKGISSCEPRRFTRKKAA
jgi:HAMP domain-containing protein